MKKLLAFAFTFVLASAPVMAVDPQEVSDTKTPLHLLKPDYKVPYGELTVEGVKADLDRVFNYIDKVTPAVVLDKNGKVITSYKNLPSGAHLNQGTFRLGSYEWGVTYQALLEASKILNDPKYKNYAVERLKVVSEAAPAFGKLLDKGETEAQMRQIARPATLDDAGAMASATMRVQMAEPSLKLGPIIDGYTMSSLIRLISFPTALSPERALTIMRYGSTICIWEFRRLSRSANTLKIRSISTRPPT